MVLFVFDTEIKLYRINSFPFVNDDHELLTGAVIWFPITLPNIKSASIKPVDHASS